MRPSFEELLEEAMDLQNGICIIQVRTVRDLDSSWTNQKLAYWFKCGRVMTLKLYKGFMDVPGNEKKLDNMLFDYLAQKGGNEIFKQEYDHEQECYVVTINRVS